MGWGAGNPEPSPGEYDWGSLDTRVELMRRTGARIVITLCCAPDWMKGGEPGETDWSNLEGSIAIAFTHFSTPLPTQHSKESPMMQVAPLPEHYADFADLCAKVAERYPDVEAFQGGNPQFTRWRHILNGD